MLAGKTVLLCVSGSIAAYKIAYLASALKKLKADVHVLMTRNATNFINPITFETLTGNKCLVDTFDRNFEFSVEHVSLAKAADVVLVAPASANVIAKLAHGLADDMLTTTVLACTCKKIISPAMNTRMFENPITQDNLKLCEHYGMEVISPASGYLACGDTGAGKTTITNLINRFYDVQGGSVIYDGIDVRDIKKDALRRSLGIVLQDTHLFTGTVAENIRFGKLDATQEEIEKAAKIANADSFIRRLPHGYDTLVTADGANLSQGQRQLLAIARAAVADPPVLILDEATSSVDTRTEALIERGMDQLMEGRTVFVIAHRLSTVRNSNAIMVLEQGKIVERGDHDDLLEQKGKYYQLYHGMFELS